MRSVKFVFTDRSHEFLDISKTVDIERACCENVLFMAMSCMQRPDHSTIAAFVSSLKDQIKPLFTDILLVCDQEGLLGGTFFAIDGCKLSSNASKAWSGKVKDLKKKKQKIERINISQLDSIQFHLIHHISYNSSSIN